MAYKLDTLSTNNSKPIKVIEEEGNVINLAPIKAYYQLQVTNLIANQAYKISLNRSGRDLLPISLAAWSSANINNGDNFYLKIYDGTSYQWGLNLSGKKTIDTNGFLFSFPEIPINHEYTLEITSQVALTKVIISCVPVYIYDELIKSD
jgi:hypothetical protein